MSITVRRLALHADLGLTLVAGRENAGRAISWAHPIELADPTPYLFGGELVMTTGLKVADSDDEQFEYVRRLSGANVAALAFSTGQSYRRVPDGIIRAADAFGLPVLSVPAPTPFIAITRAVIDEINAEQVREVRRVVTQQEILARETLRGGVPAVVAALSRLLSATAVVLDPEGRALAAAGADPDRVAALGADQIAAVANRSRGPTARVVADGDGYCLLQPLRVTEAVRGWLTVRTAGSPASTDRLLVAHAVALICIELEKPDRVLDTETRLRDAVTRTLLRTPEAVEPAVLRYFGFDPDGEVTVLALTDAGPALPAAEQARKALSDTAIPFLMCGDGDDLVVVLPAAEAACADRLRRDMTAQLQRPVGAGVSAAQPVGRLGAALTQARTAALAGGPGTLSRFGRLGTFGVLLGSRSDAELRLIAAALDPLDEALAATLAGYLEHNGHVENAAAELGVHRHTMRNRLARITETLGADLASADTRAQLWLALRAREVLALRADC